MVYKTYDCKTFRVHTIKTNKFKTCHMEIVFSKEINKKTLSADSMLCDMLSFVSSKYKTRKDFVIHSEELYKASFLGLVGRYGNVLNTSYVLDFINPEFINSNNYLEDVIKFPFEMIQNPLVENDEFDEKSFKIIKDRLLKDIDSIKEIPSKIACKKALELMDKDSPSSLLVSGTKEDVLKITPASLYEHYKKFFKDHVCNIFIIGSVDMDYIVKLIKKYFQNRIINDTPIDFFVNNKLAKKSKIVFEDSGNVQANIIMIYNIKDLTKEERDVSFYVYNYILGNGGLNSKLYKKIRMENSLCYSINSIYLKYDKLLLIQISLDTENVKKAYTLVKKCISSMAHGDFSEEDIENAKSNLGQALLMSQDNNIAITNNYIFHILDDFPRIDRRTELYNKVTKKQIVDVAKKLRLNTIFVLNGEKK